MMDAAYGLLALLLVTLAGAGCAMASRLRRIRPKRISAEAAPPIAKTHRTHSAPRGYRTGASGGSTGLRLAIERSHAKREQKRRERKEFQAWLEITSEPL